MTIGKSLRHLPGVIFNLVVIVGFLQAADPAFSQDTPDQIQRCHDTDPACNSSDKAKSLFFDTETGNDALVEQRVDQEAIFAAEPEEYYAKEPGVFDIRPAAGGLDDIDSANIEPSLKAIDDDMTVVENCSDWIGEDEDVFCGQQVTCDRIKEGICYFNSYKCAAFSNGKCYILNGE